MLRELVENKLTQFETSFDTWEEAVRASYTTMLNQNIVEEVYVDRVVDCIKEFGLLWKVSFLIKIPQQKESYSDPII